MPVDDEGSRSCLGHEEVTNKWIYPSKYKTLLIKKAFKVSPVNHLQERMQVFLLLENNLKMV